MRPKVAWPLSVAAGAVAYAAFLVGLAYDAPFLPEGRFAEGIGWLRLLPIPLFFAAVALVAPRPWGVPPGLLVGAFAFFAAVAWGGLWETGENYEGPGPMIGVVGVAWYGLFGAVGGATARTLWAAARARRDNAT